MDTSSILLGIRKKLPTRKMGDAALMELKDRLDSLSDSQRNEVNFKIQSSDIKSPVAMAVWNVVFGTLGVARFMIGDIALGAIRLAYQIITFVVFVLAAEAGEESAMSFVYLVLMIGIWIWWIVDIFLVDKKVRMQNLRKVLLAIDSVKNQSK